MLLGVLCAGALWAGDFTLTVEVRGLKSEQGMVLGAVHGSAATFPAKPVPGYLKGKAKIENGVAELRFEGLDEGQYAVLVFHDENGNGKLDRNAVGLPKEPMGISNDVKPKMAAPKFEEAAVAVKGDLKIVITVK